jgi:hypothetical protein
MAAVTYEGFNTDRDAETVGDLAVAQLSRELESENFFDLAHGHPYSRHLSSPSFVSE